MFQKSHFRRNSSILSKISNRTNPSPVRFCELKVPTRPRNSDKKGYETGSWQPWNSTWLSRKTIFATLQNTTMQQLFSFHGAIWFCMGPIGEKVSANPISLELWDLLPQEGNDKHPWASHLPMYPHNHGFAATGFGTLQQRQVDGCAAELASGQQSHRAWFATSW